MSDNISSLPYWNCNLVKQMSCPPHPLPSPSFSSCITFVVASSVEYKTKFFCYRAVLRLTRSRMVSFYNVVPRDWPKKFRCLVLNQSEVKQQLSSRTISSHCFSWLAPVAWIGFQIPPFVMSLGVVILVLRRTLLPYFWLLGAGVNRLADDRIAEKGAWKKCSYVVNFIILLANVDSPVLFWFTALQDIRSRS